MAITFRVCLITIWEGMGGWCFGGNPMVECKVKWDSQLQYIPIATDFAQLQSAGWRHYCSGMVYIGIIFGFFKSQMSRDCFTDVEAIDCSGADEP